MLTTGAVQHRTAGQCLRSTAHSATGVQCSECSAEWTQWPAWLSNGGSSAQLRTAVGEYAERRRSVERMCHLVRQQSAKPAERVHFRSVDRF